MVFLDHDRSLLTVDILRSVTHPTDNVNTK